MIFLQKSDNNSNFEFEHIYCTIYIYYNRNIQMI